MVRQERDFIIDRLHSGGVITNYYCTSSCGHCLYCCGPLWKKEYISEETLTGNLQKIEELGCRSVHIGGGEPLLDPEGLKTVIRTARSMGVVIEYVETNSSWYRDRDSARRALSGLKSAGLSMLLVSMSPFHNEHIPFFKVKGVVEACNDEGVKVFPWISEFYSEISALGDRDTHTMREYEDMYGPDYLKRLPSRYWIHFGGRALRTFAPVFGARPFEDFLDSGGNGCGELLDVSHFHLDLFGNYIPGLCSGLAIERNDLGKKLYPEKYPILNTLFREGVRGLYSLAADSYGFKPSPGYMSKCHFCFDMRRYLVLEAGVKSRELQPADLYANA